MSRGALETTLFALLAATFFAGAHIAARRGLQDVGVAAGTLLSMIISAVVTGGLLLANPPAVDPDTESPAARH